MTRALTAFSRIILQPGYIPATKTSGRHRLVLRSTNPSLHGEHEGSCTIRAPSDLRLGRSHHESCTLERRQVLSSMTFKFKANKNSNWQCSLTCFPAVSANRPTVGIRAQLDGILIEAGAVNCLGEYLYCKVGIKWRGQSSALVASFLALA